MDVKEKIDAVKQKLISLSDSITEYVQENKTNAIIIGSVGILIIVLLIIVIAMLSSKKTPESETRIQPEIHLSEPLIVPDGPELQKEYELSRKAGTQWTDEEIDFWFTAPTQKDIDNLSRANQKLVTDILEAAP